MAKSIGASRALFRSTANLDLATKPFANSNLPPKLAGSAMIKGLINKRTKRREVSDQTVIGRMVGNDGRKQRSHLASEPFNNAL